MMTQQLTTLETGVYKAEIEDLTAMVMKTFSFWDITPYSLVKVNGTFRRNASAPFQGSLFSSEYEGDM
jgi:hypothetical protein